jgi:hypothetical protein
VKIPVPVPSEVFELVVVGAVVIAQQTPFAVMGAFPSADIFPPETAVVSEMLATVVVVREGKAIGVDVNTTSVP